MEPQNGAPSDGVAAPFSELISAWLDEGDRLNEKAIATAASVPAVTETRAGRLLSFVRPVLDRHRVLVFAAAGLVPLGLFALTHRSAASPVPVLAAAIPSVATASASALAGLERAATAGQTPTPPALAAPPAEIAGLCERAEAEPALPEPRSPEPRPAPRPRHHHHHLAAKPPAPCLKGACAVARTAPPAPAAIKAPSAHAVSPALPPPARPTAPAGPMAIARPVASIASARPVPPPRSAPGPRKGQPLR